MKLSAHTRPARQAPAGPCEEFSDFRKDAGYALTEVDARPFQLAKFLSWISFVLILGTSLAFSVLLARSARQTLLEKQQDFALLQAENLNHQIFQRFTLPTLLRFGYIELENNTQYKQLDNVIKDTTHGQAILNLYIFDTAQTISYALDIAVTGRTDMAGPLVGNSLLSRKYFFEIINNTSALLSFFSFELSPQSVVMRTTYPLIAERGVRPGSKGGQLMGILVFTQDITDDYKAVIGFQWSIIITSLASSLLLFVLLVLLIRKADTIHRHRLEQTRLLERDLYQAEKLASMGRVVAGIAHEIRNPLGIIQSSTELLLRRAQSEGSASRTKMLQIMYDELRRLGKTVTDFLDYARPGKLRRETVDMAQLLEQARTFLEHECSESGIILEKDYTGPLSVQGDKALLYRAVYNVLTNAVDAIGRDGTIRVTGSVDKAAVKVTIQDSGPGFSPEVLEKIRDPFFTTKDKGTGLGLALVDTILRSHRGRLEFSNRATGGGQVELYFDRSA